MHSSLHTKPIFVFDWHGVLADHQPVRAAAAEIFALAGVPRDIEQEAYARAVERGGYHFRQHLQEVLKSHSVISNASDALTRAFEASLHHQAPATYPDVDSFLRRLANRYATAVIVAGDIDFEQRTIERSGIAKRLEHMIFIPGAVVGEGNAKARSLGQLLEMYPSVIYFDNDHSVLSDIHAAHTGHNRLITFRVDRKQEKAAHYSHTIRTFDERLPDVVERLLAAD